MEDQKQFVDRLLDRGLGSLGEHEPEPGLETRILSRLRAQKASPHARIRSWQFGLSLAAVATFAVSATIFLFYRANSRQPVAPTFTPGRAGLKPGVPARGEQPAVTQMAMNAGRGGRAMNRSRVQMNRTAAARVEPATAAPRLSVFPSPAPMTEEEKLVIAYSRVGPPPSADPFAEQREQMIKLGLEPPPNGQPTEEPSARRN